MKLSVILLEQILHKNDFTIICWWLDVHTFGQKFSQNLVECLNCLKENKNDILHISEALRSEGRTKKH